VGTWTESRWRPGGGALTPQSKGREAAWREMTSISDATSRRTPGNREGQIPSTPSPVEVSAWPPAASQSCNSLRPSSTRAGAARKGRLGDLLARWSPIRRPSRNRRPPPRHPSPAEVRAGTRQRATYATASTRRQPVIERHARSPKEADGAPGRRPAGHARRPSLNPGLPPPIHFWKSADSRSRPNRPLRHIRSCGPDGVRERRLPLTGVRLPLCYSRWSHFCACRAPRQVRPKCRRPLPARQSKRSRRLGFH
jgi:hypothetical protein